MLQRQFVDEIYRDGRLNKINNIMICIYKIANNVNDKIYIGQTNNINQRWQKHKYCAKVGMGNAPFHKAIKLYGVNNFSIEVLIDGLTREEANKKEVELISLYGANKKHLGYNVCSGGLGHNGVFGKDHPMYGKKRPHLTKLNKSRSGIKLSESHKAKINPLGRIVSAETKQKMSNKRKGAWVNGKYLTDEYRQNISKAKTGKSIPKLMKGVFCIETGQRFDSVQSTAKFFNVGNTAISNSISRGSKLLKVNSLRYTETAD